MPKKINVGIDISQIVYGTGVSDYTNNLVQELQKLESELDLTLFGSSLRKQSTIKSLFPSTKIFPFPPTFLNYLWNTWHILPVENLIGKVDVFHASDWTQPPTNAPTVTTVHDLSPIIYPKEMGKNIFSVHNSRLKWATKECSKIICVSKTTALDLEKYYKYNPSKIEIIPEALPSRFDIDILDTEVQNIKSKWNLSDYVISVGTPQPRKNYPRLINAFINYQSQYRLPSKLVLVGGGGWGSSIAANPSIIQTGYLPDRELAALVRGAQSLVLPSLYEGFGLPILVAWRQNVPVCASHVGSLSEVVEHAGILFDPLDEESIATGIANSIAQKKHLQNLGRNRLTIYNWSSTAQKTFSVYKTLC